MLPDHTAYINLLIALADHESLAFLLLALKSADPSRIDSLAYSPNGAPPLNAMSWIAVFAPALLPLAVDAGANVNQLCPGTGCTPLYVAVTNRDLPLAARLLTSGANPNLRSKCPPPTFPLGRAAFACDFAMVDLLFEHGASDY